jgi:hypothetical protein
MLLVLVAVVLLGAAYREGITDGIEDGRPRYWVLKCGSEKLQFGPFMQMHDCNSRNEMLSWLCPDLSLLPAFTEDHRQRWQLLCGGAHPPACHCVQVPGLVDADAALDQQITAFLDEPHARCIAPLPGEVSKPPVPLPGEVGKHDEHGRKGGGV